MTRQLKNFAKRVTNPKPSFVIPDNLTPYRRPQYYIGETFEDYYVGPAQTRDSSVIEQSNFDTALEMLGGEVENRVEVQRASHWACGWVEVIYVHRKAKKQLKILSEIVAALEDYPILDEGDWSEREYEAFQKDFDQWGESELKDNLEKMGVPTNLIEQLDETHLWRIFYDTASATGGCDDYSIRCEYIRDYGFSDIKYEVENKPAELKLIEQIKNICSEYKG